MRLINPISLKQSIAVSSILADGRSIEEIIDSEPGIELIMCRDCKHFNLKTHECENEAVSTDHEGGASYSLNFWDDDFCSYGERRCDEHEAG